MGFKLGKRTQLIQTIFIIILFVATFSTFDSSYIPSDGSFTKAEDVYTISEPTGKSLELLGQYDENLGMPFMMFVDEDFLYIACRKEGIVKMDLSDPSQPKIVGIHRNESEYYRDTFCIKNNIGYIVTYDNFLVMNFTDINNAIELSRIPELRYSRSIKLYGNLLIVNSPYRDIRFYDITNPANMVLLNTINFTFLDFDSNSFDYVNDNLYIIGENYDGNSTLLIYNIAEINNPIYTGNFTMPYRSRGMKVQVDGDIAYVMDRYELLVMNITNTTKPSLINSITLSQDYNYLKDIVLADDILYVLNESSLITLDVSNSSAISILDIDDENLHILDLAIKGNYLYITNTVYYELLIYDAHISSNPQKTSPFSFGGYSYDVCVKNKVAYVANSENGIQIIDVSDVRNPQLIGSYYDGDRIYLVEMSKSILYATSNGKCMKLIDISNPRNPMLLSEYQSEGMIPSVREIKISENLVYLVYDFGKIGIIDVSDSANLLMKVFGV